MKFRKKPVVIEAIQFLDQSSINKMCNIWCRSFMDVTDFGNEKTNFFILTLEGEMMASVGDWIIKGVNGEFYPCKPDIFEKTYEKVSDE